MKEKQPLWPTLAEAGPEARHLVRPQHEGPFSSLDLDPEPEICTCRMAFTVSDTLHALAVEPLLCVWAGKEGKCVTFFFF